MRKIHEIDFVVKRLRHVCGHCYYTVDMCKSE